jgi:hypothetical protein
MGLFSAIKKVVGGAAKVAGPLLQVGGTLSGNPGLTAAGGFLGGLGSKPKVYSSGDSLRSTVKAARELGIHPLAALGAAGSGFTQVDGGSAFRDAAEATERAVDRSAAKSGEALNAQLARKQMEVADAEIAEARSRTLINEAEHKRLIFGPRQPTNGTHGGIEMLDRRPVVQDPARNLASRQQVQLGGSVATGPNPEAFEVGLSELMAGAIIYGPQWAYDFLKRQSKSRPRPDLPKGTVPTP